MIRIKAVDAQNIIDVCELTANQNVCAAAAGPAHSNAIYIAETKYNSEMHPNAIYDNNVLIGFFMYRRAEKQADTATICRFMVDYRYQSKSKKALEYVLRGLKIQGVRKAVVIIDNKNENERDLYLSFGFQFTEKIADVEYYELEL